MSAQAMVHPGEKAHPQSREYVILAIILSAVTGIEVAAWYWEAIRAVVIGSTVIDLLPPVLIVMSAFKFALVVMFYMHLKFDHRLFSAVFLFGLGAAGFIILVFIALFHFLRAPFPVG